MDITTYLLKQDGFFLLQQNGFKIILSRLSTIQVFIDGVDKTSSIVTGSLVKQDNINDQVDQLSFSLDHYTPAALVPEVNSEVELKILGVTEFRGVIMQVTQTTNDGVVRYDVNASDWSAVFGRRLATGQYSEMSVADIINDLVTLYSEGFTTDNVVCDIIVTTISFDRISLLDALRKLADITNYQFYIDYQKDIHFFAKTEEPAPFNLNDTNDSYIYDSLTLSDDISQVRNRVFIRGGDAVGATRTEKFIGDGDQVQFGTTNKFSALKDDDGAPILFVTLGGVAQTIGVDFSDSEDDFDVLWNFEQKYIKFTTPPATDAEIEITGLPIFPIVVQVDEPNSIAKYGLCEFAKTDKTIRTREEARQYGIAQLKEYAAAVFEGSFDTYMPGLRSGQIIHITSPSRGVDSDFLIQRVRYKTISPQLGFYTVTIATWRTIGVVDFLISLLRTTQQRIAGDSTSEVLDKITTVFERITINDTFVVAKIHDPEFETITISESVTVQALDYPVEFGLAPYLPTGTKRVFILDGSRLG